MNVLEKIKSVDYLKQLKRVALGSAMAAPIAIIVYAVGYAITAGWLSEAVVINTIMVTLGVFFLWSIGGLFETVHNSRKAQKEYEEKKTMRAFEKLAGGKL
jgi:hypothetical protein